MEHQNSAKPAALISLYLILTIILDLALTRTLWIRSGMQALASTFTVSLVLKTVLLVLEETPKRLSTGEKGSVRETSVGVVNRSFFWWLNHLFVEGFRGLIDLDSLGALNEKFNTHDLSERIEERWKRGRLFILVHTFTN